MINAKRIVEVGTFTGYSALQMANEDTMNTAANNGAGIYCGYSATLSLTNVTITDNSSTNHGGAMYNSSGSVTIKNCTITANTASTECGGIYVDGSVTIINSILWNSNTEDITVSGIGSVSVSYSTVEGGQSSGVTGGGTINWNDGNIVNDPVFTKKRCKN